MLIKLCVPTGMTFIKLYHKHSCIHSVTTPTCMHIIILSLGYVSQQCQIINLTSLTSYATFDDFLTEHFFRLLATMQAINKYIFLSDVEMVACTLLAWDR